MTSNGATPEPRARRWHRFVDHVGELELEVVGEDLAGLLAEAARALGQLLSDSRRVESPLTLREIEVHSVDREALLVDLLNEMILIAETDLWAPLELEIQKASDRHVLARGRGVQLARAPSLVKAATLHRLSVRSLGSGLQAKVVFDV